MNKIVAWLRSFFRSPVINEAYRESRWCKPWVRWTDVELAGHKSCWNCEHIRVATMFNRKCVQLPMTNIFGSADCEARERNGVTIADKCPLYNVDTRVGYDGITKSNKEPK